MAKTTLPALTALRVTYVQMVKERQHLEAELLSPQPMRAGSLSSLLMQCGKENCICKDKRNPRKHGPYDYWRKLVNGKQKLIYLKEDDGEIKEQLRSYRSFQRLLVQYRKVVKAMDAVFVTIRQGSLIDDEK
jgi:hypothetical protein